MKRLFVGAVVAALCGAPGMSRAETPTAPREVVAPAARDAQARPAQDAGEQTTEGDASDYAAREKASPELAQFAGGDNGIYIGGGVIVAALLVVLLLTAL